MALPIKEARQIAGKINKQFGGWGWKATVETTENEIVVRSTEKGGMFGFGPRLQEFTDITKGWSFSAMMYKEQLCLVIW